MTTILRAPATYPDDDPHEADAVLALAIQATATLTETLEAIARRYSDIAPASSDQVRKLLAVLSAATLDWIWRWPS